MGTNVAEKTDKGKAQTTKDLSEAWMIDNLGKMDSESEEENETLATAGEKETVNKEIVNALSEAWMIDDVGTINSDSEEEKELSPRLVTSSSNANIIGKTKNEGSTETKVCSSNTNTNKKQMEIPVAKTKDLSEAWMIDDVGTIESESEEENESSPENKKSIDKKDISENKQKVKEDTISHYVGIIDPESENENVTIMETK